MCRWGHLGPDSKPAKTMIELVYGTHTEAAGKNPIARAAMNG